MAKEVVIYILHIMKYIYIHTYIYIYIYNEILFSYKKEVNLTICDNMDGTWGHQVKWNKSERDKYHMMTYIWNLEQNKTKQNEKLNS